MLYRRMQWRAATIGAQAKGLAPASTHMAGQDLLGERMGIPA
jgi:hypothetical protein